MDQIKIGPIYGQKTGRAFVFNAVELPPWSRRGAGSAPPCCRRRRRSRTPYLEVFRRLWLLALPLPQSRPFSGCSTVCGQFPFFGLCCVYLRRGWTQLTQAPRSRIFPLLLKFRSISEQGTSKVRLISFCISITTSSYVPPSRPNWSLETKLLKHPV